MFVSACPPLSGCHKPSDSPVNSCPLSWQPAFSHLTSLVSFWKPICSQICGLFLDLKQLTTTSAHYLYVWKGFGAMTCPCVHNIPLCALIISKISILLIFKKLAYTVLGFIKQCLKRKTSSLILPLSHTLLACPGVPTPSAFRLCDLVPPFLTSLQVSWLVHTLTSHLLALSRGGKEHTVPKILLLTPLGRKSLILLPGQLCPTLEPCTRPHTTASVLPTDTHGSRPPAADTRSLLSAAAHTAHQCLWAELHSSAS